MAGRYVRTRRRDRMNVTTFLSVFGLIIGGAVLITVLSIMNALQHRQIESIIAFNSYHLRIGGVTAERLLEKPSAIHDLRIGVNGIRSIVPFTDVEGMARGYQTDISGIRFRAVPPEILRLDDGLMHSLEISAGSFDIGRVGTVVLGSELAQELGVGPGDRISIMVMPSGDNLANPVEIPLEVTGLFRIGFYEYDRNCAFISLATGQTMVGPLKNMHVGIKLDDREADWAAMQAITHVLVDSGRASRSVLGREMVSWRSFNAAIFGALRVEKLMIMIIVGLVFIVVAVNIFYGLRRSVFEKTEDIGVLRALGAPASTIQMIFVLEGLVIGLLGGLGALALGWLLSDHINSVFQAAETAANAARDFWIGLAGNGNPDGSRISLFLLDRVPSRLLPGEACAVGLAAFLSAAVAAWAASRRVSRIRPAEILRNE